MINQVFSNLITMNRVTLNRAYGNLFGIEQWEYFSTLTYRFSVSMKRNRIEMDKLVNGLKNLGLAFSMVWVSEWHKSGTSTHSHLLTKEVDVSLVNKYWSSQNLGYRNDHKAYERDKGANFYMAKYFNKEVDYDYVW